MRTRSKSGVTVPLYEYKCEKCEARIEVLQNMADPPLETHEGCGGQLDKQVSLSSFQLKGSGWYATDYGKGRS